MVRFSHSDVPGEYKDVEVGSSIRGLRFGDGKRPDTIELVNDSTPQDELIHWIYEWVVPAFDADKHNILTNFIGEISGRQFYKG